MTETERIHISDEEIEAIPLRQMIDAVTEALQALGRGEIDISPRNEILGRKGDPDYLRIEMDAVWNRAGKPDWYCRKVIEESGARDTSGARVLGSRSAWIELRDTARNRVITLDAEVITNVRTGIAAALGSRWLSSNQSVTLAIIGTGRIAGATLRAAAQVLDVHEVRVTSRSASNRTRFVRELSSELGLPILPFESVRECVRGADIVVAAVPSSNPVVVSADVVDVPQITLVGGDPRVVLADSDVFSDRLVVVDSYEQALRTGDFVRTADDGFIGSVRWAQVDGRPATLADASLGCLTSLCGEMTILVLTGIAALDLAVARLAWERRLRTQTE